MNSYFLIQTDWMRRSLGGLLVMVALSPLFAWGAKQVGYAEPLTNAAEMTGATTEAVTLLSGVLPGYTVPGTGPYLGTLIAGGIGTALALGCAVALGYLLETSH